MEALSIKNGNWAHIFGKPTCPKALTGTEKKEAELAAREKEIQNW